MIRTLLIDDEPHANSLLKTLIEDNFPQIATVITTVSSIQEAKAVLLSEKIDLVFLDIQMPGENGFDLFNYFPHPDFEVVFVTAYDHYAIQAFKYSAFDYLLKPINLDILKETLHRYLPIKNRSNRQKEQIQVLKDCIANVEEGKKRIIFNTAEGVELPLVNSILYFEASHNYCDIYFKDGKRILVSQSLKSIEDRLPPDLFFRTHRSYIVALDSIIRYDRKEKKAILEDGSEVEVSFRREQLFLNKILEKS